MKKKITTITLKSPTTTYRKKMEKENKTKNETTLQQNTDLSPEPQNYIRKSKISLLRPYVVLI